MTTDSLDNNSPEGKEKNMPEETKLGSASQQAVEPANATKEEKASNEAPAAEQQADVQEAPVKEEVPAVETTAAEAPAPAAAVEAPAPEAVAETAEEAPAEATAAQEEAIHKMSKEQILARLKEIAADVEHASKTEIDSLKQAFYKLHNTEVEAARQAFAEAGNDPATFVPTSDPVEEEFKKTMSVIREKRNEINANLEKQKEMNYQVKLSIIEELKDLIDSPEDPNKNFAEFKRLQQQWNEVTLVPQNKENELWKNYQANVEKFYDLLKLNNEFRDYDFKKNLETKIHLCEEAEKLAQDPDVVSAFHQLQKLHQEYRDAGPVAKEKREEIWNRFKAASTVINRRHQQHFEELKKNEQDNLDQKTVICEIVEGINYDELTGFKQWDSKTKEVISLQEKWKTIGFAPHKMNAKIFERFRKACDEFFNRKAEFYKAAKAKMADNLAQKRALCEKAEALKDSTDWKATADELTKLQKQWKEIGPVAKKYSNQVWQRFINACDYFFDQKNKATSSQRTAETDNLKRKKEIIEKLKALASDAEDDLQQKVSDLQKEWNSIGHVPFKEKDKIYEKYRAVVDELYKSINTGRAGRRLSKFRSTISSIQSSGAQTVNRERDKLTRLVDTLSSELHTYENNLGFLNTSSKSGNALLNELQKKMQKLRDEIQLTKDKIKAIDEGAAAAPEAKKDSKPAADAPKAEEPAKAEEPKAADAPEAPKAE